MYHGKYEKAKNIPDVTPDVTQEQPQDPTPVAPPSNRKPRQQKKTISKGSKIFYGCLLGFVLVFFIGVFIGMGALNNWLIGFEAAQPKSKSQEVFNQLFTNPNWASLYKTAGEQDTPFENAATYAAYMNTVVGSKKLTFAETVADVEGDHKYVVRVDKRDIASFTLTADNKDAQVPDWKLGAVELNYARTAFCNILAAPGSTITVNGVTLDDSFLVKRIATKAEDHLPEDLHGYQAVVYRVDQLLVAPKVTVTDANGEAVELTYNADTCTFIYPMESMQVTDAEKNTLVNAAQVYCKYMIGQVGTTTLKKSFDSTSAVYKTMTSISKWMQSYKSYAFEDAVITDYYRYSDNLYSARVDMSLLVTRKDNTVKDYPLHSTFIMEKQADGWKVIDMLNLNIQEQTVSVRLTYMDNIENGKQIHTEMVDADAKLLTAPTVTAPEGMVFAGWITISVDENGKPSHNLAFKPDENGNVVLSGETALEPMVLYAHFEAKEG